MRVITYNLHKGKGPGSRDVFGELMHAIAERKPDLLLCQELFCGHNEVGQAARLGQLLGLRHVYAPNVQRRVGSHGNAIFSRWRIVRSTNFDISDPILQRRGILRSHLASDAGTLTAINTHFSLTGRRRLLQWRRLLEVLPGEDSPLIVCGDFNDWRQVLDRKARSGCVLANALWDLPSWQRRTFPARRPLLALDRIYYRGLRLVDVKVLSGLPWAHMSDHLPVEAVFQVKA